MTSLIQNIRFGLAPEIGKPRTEGNYQLCLSCKNLKTLFDVILRVVMQLPILLMVNID